MANYKRKHMGYKKPTDVDHHRSRELNRKRDTKKTPLAEVLAGMLFQCETCGDSFFPSRSSQKHCPKDQGYKRKLGGAD